MQKVVAGMKFSELYKAAVSDDVKVSMPEFKCDLDEELTDFCKEMGINKIFTPEADFPRMSSEWLKIDSIIHKSHIEVDRKETKAAAVTEAIACCGCAYAYKVKEVCLDRPLHMRS